MIAAVLWIGVWIWRKDWSIGLLVGYLFLILAETVLIRSPGELRYELAPFWSWAEVFKKWPMTYTTKMLFEQIVLNILMFIPVGMILSRKMGSKSVLAATGISSVIEITQLFTRRGLFEIDDVIHNTLGAAIGFGIYVLLRRIRKNDF